MWGNSIAEESCDVCECSSMLASNFTLNSGGRSPAMRRSESRARSAQRRLNIAPIRMTFDENMATEHKSIIDEMSFYDANSPQSSPRSCSISPCMEMDGLLYSPDSSPSHFMSAGNNSTSNGGVSLSDRRSFGDLDYNSVDSGYGANSTDSRICFKFAEPAGVPPKRTNELSPPKMLATSSSSSLTPPKSNSCFRPFNSVSSDSIDSMDDDYMELLDMESMEEDTHLPSHFNSIISGDIKSSPQHSAARPAGIRRCLSLVASPKTPEILKTVADSNTPFLSRAFKRPEAPAFSPTQSKRFKCASPSSSSSSSAAAISEDKENAIAIPSIAPELPPVRHNLRKSMSMNDANIMSALARSSSQPDLIGDFSKPFCLPLMPGRHSDLKSISHETLAKLLQGEYDHEVNSYRIIDCRYPYEFEGGHIAGAENLYTQEEILKALVQPKTQAASVAPEGPKRDIIVFHCEFSSERGPKLSRFLRSNDRQSNTNVYPALHYPEIYLLHGGYKDFFEGNAELCSPVAYRPMLDPEFGSAYRHFRAQTKSWSGDAKTAATSNRLVKSRSRLVL